jgi:hypothetical protein
VAGQFSGRSRFLDELPRECLVYDAELSALASTTESSTVATFRAPATAPPESHSGR